MGFNFNKMTLGGENNGGAELKFLTGYFKTGNPTINNSVVSGFSSSNYLNLPSSFAPSNKTWEISFKIKTGNDIATEQFIYCFGTVNSTNNARGVRLGIKSSKTELALSFDGESKTDVYGTKTLSKNTEYLVKVEFTGSKYNVYIDGVADNSYTSSSTISSGTINMIGSAFINNDVGGAFLGSIDLSQSFILANNQVWWLENPYL